MDPQKDLVTSQDSLRERRQSVSSDLSMQLLGKFQIIENVVVQSIGPFVRLKDCQLVGGKQQLLNRNTEPRVAVNFKRKRKAPSVSCTLCYNSFVDNQTKHNFQYQPEVLRKFVETLITPNDNTELDRFPVCQCKSLPFCGNCYAAIKYFVDTMQQIKELELDALHMQKRFQSVIKLSSEIIRGNCHEPTSIKSTAECVSVSSVVGPRDLEESISSAPLTSQSLPKQIMVDIKIEDEEDNDEFDNTELSVQQHQIHDNKPVEKKLRKNNRNLLTAEDHWSSFTKKPPETLSQSQKAKRWRQFRLEYPGKTQKELLAIIRELSTTRRNTAKTCNAELSKKPGEKEPRKQRNDVGLKNYRSFTKLPPETLSQSTQAKRWRALRLQYPDKTQREIKALFKNDKITKCEIDKDGRIFYKGVEIKKLESGLYACSKCEEGKTGTTGLGGMQMHINRLHVPNPLSCSKCGKGYYYHHQLERHVRYCQRNERLVCHLCGVTFVKESSQTAHMRFVHKGIKPHSCEYCGKAFGTVKDLTIHVRRHTGERPFVCHVCGTSFIEKYSMRKHIQKKHPGEEGIQISTTARNGSSNVGEASGSNEMALGLISSTDTLRAPDLSDPIIEESVDQNITV